MKYGTGVKQAVWVLFFAVFSITELTGCGQSVPVVMGCYDIADISVMAGKGEMEHPRTYAFSYEKEVEDGCEKVVVRNFYVDKTNMKHVRSAEECPYGYKNCYVVDLQKNETLYLLEENM